MNLQRHGYSQRRKFKIGDIADILDVKKFVVRAWEKEFDLDKTGSGVYSEEDVALFKKIKDLMAQKVSVSDTKQFVANYYAEQKAKLQEVREPVSVPQAEAVLAVEQQDEVVPMEESKELFFAAVEEVPVVAAVMENSATYVEPVIEKVFVECTGDGCVATQKMTEKITQLKTMILELQAMLQ